MTPSGLKELRKQHSISIVQLSELTGIPQATIALYEEGDKIMPEETVEVLESEHAPSMFPDEKLTSDGNFVESASALELTS